MCTVQVFDYSFFAFLLLKVEQCGLKVDIFALPVQLRSDLALTKSVIGSALEFAVASAIGSDSVFFVAEFSADTTSDVAAAPASVILVASSSS